MKIIINATILDHKPTGLGVYTINVLKWLKKNRFNYALFSSVGAPAGNTGKWFKLPKYIRPYPYKKFGGICRFIINQIYFTYIAKDFNIAYLPTPHGSLFLNNQIITVHDLLAIHFPKQHRLQYYYYKYIMPIILQKAKHIIAISESTKSDLLSIYKLKEDKITVIYNGFDHQQFSYKVNAIEYIQHKYNVKNFIFVVGSAYPHKNIEKLIEAFSLIDDDDLKLVITGSINIYQKKIINNKLNDNIIFTGFVANDEMPYFYSAAKVMIYPSLYEGFGFPPLEAMSCECPVIAANNSSIPEVCGDAVEYINPREITSLCKAIKKLTTNEPYRQKLINKGLLQVKKFSWEKNSLQLQKVLEKYV